MFRPNEHFGIMTLLAAAVLSLCPSVAAADDVADYLEQHGLKQLLSTHLEQQLEIVKPEDRGDVVLRLAGLYAELLDAMTDAGKRREIEERSQRLLEKAPINSAEELRLALLRIHYRSAEKIAESHRLRMAGAAEIEAAKKTLADILPQLNSLRLRLKHEVESSDRKLARAAGNSAAALGQKGEYERSLAAQATFLHAWALYYDSWLNQKGDSARDAETLFAALLGTENPYPQPSEVSVDLRENESIARSILGLALCKSITASTATAMAWIELLEHERTFEPIRIQAAAWKIAIYLEHRDYEHVREIVTAASSADGTNDAGPPLTWLRLIAVHCLEDQQKSRLSDDLARFAVLEIAGRGELQQVLDLANRYGPEALGKSGFGLQYVHGVLKYQQARAAHGSESPTLDLGIVALYRQAEEQLLAALNEPDATASSKPTTGGTVPPTVSCRRLIAWCRYFQSQFLEATTLFESVSGDLGSGEAAESLWMAIVCLDKLVDAGRDASSQAQLTELSERFLSEFPSDERAPLLRLRKAMATREVSEATVDELLSIPQGNDVYESAQRRAADMLYQLFRKSRGDDRYYQANRFLSVAMGLLSENARQTDAIDPAGIDRFIVRCRQVLEVSLAEGIERGSAVQAALEAIDRLRDPDTGEGLDLSAYENEIDCRRVQQQLLQRDWAAASVIADRLWTRAPSSVWTRLAERAMFKSAHSVWKSADSSEAHKLLAIEMVIRHGGRVLHEFADNGADAANLIGYQVAVADASMAMWEKTGDVERGKAALYLYDRLLAARPRNAAFLRSTAVLAEAMGDRDKALDCWRRLASGAESDSDLWYEAKYHLIKILAEADPARAREVMDQHRQLHPDYGPEPWGGMLKGLDEQIPWRKPA